MICARLFELLEGLSVTISTGTIPAGRIVHNRNELPAEMVPGIVLLDADEVRDQRFPDTTGRGVAPGPGMLKMTPEIYIVLDVRKPKNLNVGSDLNLVRGEILRLVLHDPQLQNLTGSSGSIYYDGCVTDLARNRVMQGQMGMSITFSYPFIPGEFVAV